MSKMFFDFFFKRVFPRRRRSHDNHGGGTRTKEYGTTPRPEIRRLQFSLAAPSRTVFGAHARASSCAAAQAARGQRERGRRAAGVAGKRARVCVSVRDGHVPDGATNLIDRNRPYRGGFSQPTRGRRTIWPGDAARQSFRRG